MQIRQKTDQLVFWNPHCGRRMQQCVWSTRIAYRTFITGCKGTFFTDDNAFYSYDFRAVCVRIYLCCRGEKIKRPLSADIDGAGAGRMTRAEPYAA